MLDGVVVSAEPPAFAPAVSSAFGALVLLRLFFLDLVLLGGAAASLQIESSEASGLPPGAAPEPALLPVAPDGVPAAALSIFVVLSLLLVPVPLPAFAASAPAIAPVPLLLSVGRLPRKGVSLAELPPALAPALLSA